MSRLQIDSPESGKLVRSHLNDEAEWTLELQGERVTQVA